jgi:hypothetical protein
MFIEQIAELLQSNGIGTVGTDIFIGDITTRTENGLYIVNSPSPAPNEAIDIYEQIVDFWTRNDSTEGAYSKLQQVMDVLHKRTNYTLTGYHVFISHNMNMIEDMDRDLQRKKLFRLTIRFIYMTPIA